MLAKREIKIGTSTISFYASDEVERVRGKVSILGVGNLRGKIEATLQEITELETACREIREIAASMVKL